MQFLMTIQIDQTLLDALPAGEFDRLMHGCIVHADELRAEGKLLASQQLEAPSSARTLRQREGAMRVTDGPFAETKELLAGFGVPVPRGSVAYSADQAVYAATELGGHGVGACGLRRELGRERGGERDRDPSSSTEAAHGHG